MVDDVCSANGEVCLTYYTMYQICSIFAMKFFNIQVLIEAHKFLQQRTYTFVILVARETESGWWDYTV